MPSGGQGESHNKAATNATGGDSVLGANAASMKEAEREDLGEREYNVEDFYWETGICQAIAKNEYFGHLTLGVISFNAVWIGVDSDHNSAVDIGDAEPVFQVMEQVFAVFFSFEWLMRFLSFKRKRDGLKDGWFKFDSVLVGLMVMETWLVPFITFCIVATGGSGGGGGGSGMGDASMLRLLRLLRLTRMARLMRSVPELLVLLKGMVAAGRSVFSTLALLILFTYVFAIIFKQQTEGIVELEEFFHSIPEAMWNLLMAGTLLDYITDRLNLLREKAPVMCGVFLFWVLLSSFTILNMLIGVLCEVVAAVAEAEKEKNVVGFVKGKLINILERLDKDASGSISETEFANFVDDAEAAEPLEELGVDRENLKALKDVIFAKTEVPRVPDPSNPVSDDPEVDLMGVTPSKSGRTSILAQHSMGASQPFVPRELKFGEVLEMLLDLRSDNPAMVKDVVDLRKHLRNNHKEVEGMFMDLAEEQNQVSETQADLQGVLGNLARQQEDMITNMIAPLAQGVMDIQARLRKGDHLEPLTGLTPVQQKSASNTKNGDLPPLQTTPAGAAVGAPKVTGMGAPASKEMPRVVQPQSNGTTCSEVNKDGTELSDAGTDESV